MKNLTKVLEEAVGQANTTDQKDLLNFVRAKSAEFEAAQDATAVDTILAAAVSANSITQEGKNILFAAAQKSLAMSTAESNPSPSAEDPTETVTTVNESTAANIPNDNMEQAASPLAEVRPGPTEPSADRVRTTILTASSYTAGITAGLSWLLILYLLATWIAVGSLSSIQFREDIYQKHNTTLNEIMEIKNLKLEVDQYRDKMINEVSAWERTLMGIAIDLGVQPDINDINNLDAMKTKCLGAQANPAPCTTLDKILPDYKLYRHKEDALQKVLDKRVSNISGPMSKANDLQARIDFMLNFGYSFMLVMPDQVLTLLLAMAMGVLGSTITMTWTFLEEKPKPPFRWYLLRPFVGALSALVIFIFAKAGQMTLSADAANATLSPFLLSLLGIAAGLLSDRAYAQMSSVSGRVLGDVGAEQERWSSHLEEELNKKQMTSEQLATALNLDKQRIAAIITGHQTASLQEQQRISDRLGIAPRLLFTDIPPVTSGL